MSCFSSCFGSPKEPTPYFCHGTTFSTLYMMGKQSGVGKNALVPFGKLAKEKIPCFAGECFVGISDIGVNRTYTSWATIEDAGLAESYSRRFPFNPEKVKKRLLEIITDFDRLSDAQIPFTSTIHTAHWSQLILQINQYRAWDEDDFQKELAPGLTRWIVKAKEHFSKERAKYFQAEDVTCVLKKMKLVQETLEKSPGFQVSSEDKKQILNAYPIVFMASFEGGWDSSINEEVLFSRDMRLGKEIRWVATDSSHVEELEGYLKEHDLAKRVSVMAFEKLKEISEKSSS